MRGSELQLAVQEEFGALGAGVPARRVWQALCDAKDVPADRRHGRGLREPQR